MTFVEGNASLGCIERIGVFAEWANKHIKVAWSEKPTYDNIVEFVKQWNSLFPCVDQLHKRLKSIASLEPDQIKEIGRVIEIFDQFQFMKEKYEREVLGMTNNASPKLQTPRQPPQVNTDIRKKLEACQNLVTQLASSSSISLGKRLRPPNVNKGTLEDNAGDRIKPVPSSGGKNKADKKKKGKSPYKKTSRKYTDSKGKKCTIYKKGEKEYIKKLSKSTGKFVYRSIKHRM